MRPGKKLRVLTAAMSTGLSLLAPRAESASALPPCAYPSVCFYKMTDEYTTLKTGQLRHFTRGWQWLSVSRGATWGWNTRRDDVLRVLYSDGIASCFPANRTFEFSGIVTAVRIDPAPNC